MLGMSSATLGLKDSGYGVGRDTGRPRKPMSTTLDGDHYNSPGDIREGGRGS